MTRWFERPEAALLLAAIRIEQPSYVPVRRHAWTDQRRCHFKGMNARRLRELWEAEVERAMSENDRGAYVRLVNHEHPDDVIERVLNEHTVPFTPMEMKELPDGRHRVGA